MRIASTWIIQQYLGLTGTTKITAIYPPISHQVVNFLIVRETRCCVKTYDTGLTLDTIIEKNAILIRIQEAAGVHFPGVL